jgi:biotin operon repressor
LNKTALTLLEQLIEATFENMNQEEKLAFIEQLFNNIPLKNREVLLQHLLQTAFTNEEEPEKAGTNHRPPPSSSRQSFFPQNIMPWRMCQRMMNLVDEAPWIDHLDASNPATVFGALGDETRIKIVKLLSTGRRSVGELATALEISQPNISHHLRILKEAGLVQATREGRNIYYSISNDSEP